MRPVTALASLACALVLAPTAQAFSGATLPDGWSRIPWRLTALKGAGPAQSVPAARPPREPRPSVPLRVYRSGIQRDLSRTERRPTGIRDRERPTARASTRSGAAAPRERPPTEPAGPSAVIGTSSAGGHVVAPVRR